MKESVSSFLGNVLSVILGIAITFAIQGMIDRSRDRKDVRHALELVRMELASNREDIGLIRDYLYQERASAFFFQKHGDSLAQVPEDSVSYHSGVLLADVSMSLSQDALSLLKMSSLFQKMGNTPLSMDIIRAYDACDLVVAHVNRHLAERNAHFEGTVHEANVGEITAGGIISVPRFLGTDFGRYAVRWLTAQAAPDRYTDVSDLDRAIDAIDAFLGKRAERPSRQSTVQP